MFKERSVILLSRIGVLKKILCFIKFFVILCVGRLIGTYIDTQYVGLTDVKIAIKSVVTIVIVMNNTESPINYRGWTYKSHLQSTVWPPA